MSEDSPESKKGPSKLARVAAGAAALGVTLTGLGGGVADAIPDKPQKPPAAVAPAFPQTSSSSPKTEIVGEIPGTGEHTGGRISIGIERDNNGTLNTGEDGEEPGVPARELIPDIMPNLVIGSSDGAGGTVGDGWLWQNIKTTQTKPKAIPVLAPGKSVETPVETVDATKYPIESPWEEDFHTSPELAQELRTAAEDCYSQIERRQNQGYLLTGVQIGGLASDEDNATRPGDPMAGLGEQSELNHHLANERGMAGMETMTEVLHHHGVDPAILSLLDGQEVQASPQEIDQILQYSKMLGQDPLETIQDYNRARSQGLQPLMDELFKGNRGIVCIASFTKLETQMLPGAPQVKMMMVPVEVNGEKRIWRIEIPGEVLLLPLLYIALRSFSSGGGGRPPGLIQPPKAPVSTGPGPNPNPLRPAPLKPPVPLKPIETPPPPERIKIPVVKPPKPSFSPPPKEVGQGQERYQQPGYRRKQPRPHNMNGSGDRSSGKPMGRSKGGNRRGRRTGSGR